MAVSITQNKILSFLSDFFFYEEEGRIKWLDIAKGVAIILVVLGHGLVGLHDAHMVSDQDMLWRVFYFIYTFHMPAFFLFSGIMAPSLLRQNGKAFSVRMMSKIAYPYFLWSTIQYFVIVSMGGSINHPQFFDLVGFVSIYWHSISQFWFLKALLVVHATYYAFSKLTINPKLFLLFMLVLRGCEELYQLPSILIAMGSFGLFYALGVLLSDELKRWGELTAPKGRIFLLIFALWFLFALSSFAAGDAVVVGQKLKGSLLPASLLGIMALVCFSGQFQILRRGKWLAILGHYSFPIFILHVLFAAGTRIFLVKVLGVESLFLLLSLIVLSGVLGPLLFLALARAIKCDNLLALR